MFSLMFEPANLPFAVALVLMLGIGLLEGIATVVGFGLSHALEHAFDSSVHLDHSLHPEVEAPGGVGRFLDWLHVGRVPLLAIIVVFLLCFGLTGLFVQGVLLEITGRMAPAWLAAPPVLLGVLPMVRGFAGLVAKVMPKDETTAVSRSSFIGRIATVTTGRSETGQPAPAKLKDQHGQSHYILVEPDVEGDAFEAGSAVLLVRQSGAVFRAIRNTNPSLLGNG